MGVYVHDKNWSSRRGIAFVAIIIFHVILIYGLKSGFAQKVIESIAPPIVTEILKEEKQEDTPPPPPPPKVELPPVEVPPPVVDIQVPVATNTTALSNVTDKPLPPPPPPKPVERQVTRTPPGLNKRVQQIDFEEYYPPSSKRLGEEGTSVVKVCLDEKAKVTDASIAESANFPRLDEAAVKVAKAYRYVAATEDGKPVAGCFNYRVTWKLKN